MVKGKDYSNILIISIYFYRYIAFRKTKWRAVNIIKVFGKKCYHLLRLFFILGKFCMVEFRVPEPTTELFDE